MLSLVSNIRSEGITEGHRKVARSAYSEQSQVPFRGSVDGVNCFKEPSSSNSPYISLLLDVFLPQFNIIDSQTFNVYIMPRKTAHGQDNTVTVLCSKTGYCRHDKFGRKSVHEALVTRTTHNPCEFD